VLYIASVTQQRDLPSARDYIDSKISQGKTRREARRSHKRHLANRVIRRMWKDETKRNQRALTSPLDKGVSDTPLSAAR
jgi:transposase